MDEAIAHCDLLCGVRQGSVFPGCVRIAAGHMWRGILGLQSAVRTGSGNI